MLNEQEVDALLRQGAKDHPDLGRKLLREMSLDPDPNRDDDGVPVVLGRGVLAASLIVAGCVILGGLTAILSWVANGR